MQAESEAGQRQGQHSHYHQRRNNGAEDEEDDGYNGSSDNDDTKDEDVKTLHISNTSTRLERRQSGDKGSYTLKQVHRFWRTIILHYGIHYMYLDTF